MGKGGCGKILLVCRGRVRHEDIIIESVGMNQGDEGGIPEIEAWLPVDAGLLSDVAEVKGVTWEHPCSREVCYSSRAMCASILQGSEQALMKSGASNVP